MPLENKFNDMISMVFPTVRLSDEQLKRMKEIFFAGAASAHNILVNEPITVQQVMFDELADHLQRSAPQKVA